MMPSNSVSKQMQTFILPSGTVLIFPLAHYECLTSSPDGLGVIGPPRSHAQTQSLSEKFLDSKPDKSSTNCKESDPSDPIECLPMNEFVFWLGHDYSDDKVTSSLIKKHDDVHHPESGRND